MALPVTGSGSGSTALQLRSFEQPSNDTRAPARPSRFASWRESRTQIRRRILPRTMRRRYVLALVLSATVLGAACASREHLDEPYASLLPTCSDAGSAPNLADESQSQTTDGAFGLSHGSWKRDCEGADLKVFMEIYEFTSDADATTFADNFYGSGGCSSDLTMWGDDVVKVTAEAFDVESHWYQIDSLPNDDTHGVAGTLAVFRRGRYVGNFSTSAKGEIIVAGEALCGLVVAPSTFGADVLEKLVNETTSRWSLQ